MSSMDSRSKTGAKFLSEFASSRAFRDVKRFPLEKIGDKGLVEGWGKASIKASQKGGGREERPIRSNRSVNRE